LSQIYKAVESGNLPPSVPTSFVTDNGTSVPVSNIENIIGGTSTANNSNGIATKANPNGSNTLEIDLTNRAVGSITTTNATPVNIISLPLGSTPGVYAISGSVAGYIHGANQGAGYFFEGVTRTNGSVATEFTGQFTNFDEDPAIQPAFVLATTSGNSFIIEIEGVAATTIDWVAVINFIFAS
jgi:hypothetical protein